MCYTALLKIVVLRVVLHHLIIKIRHSSGFHLFCLDMLVKSRLLPLFCRFSLVRSEKYQTGVRSLFCSFSCPLLDAILEQLQEFLVFIFVLQQGEEFTGLFLLPKRILLFMPFLSGGHLYLCKGKTKNYSCSFI